MASSARAIDRVYRYYADQIIGRQRLRFRDDDITIAEWIGEFAPARIQVIPLFEDVPNMLRADAILEEYLADKEVADQRVFLARSDTAMNYGLVAAALANKIALARLADLATRTGVRVHPILGTGSAPFRGGLSPLTAERVGMEYPSVVTFSIQSAFKFDYPPEQVRAACEHLKARRIGLPTPIDAERAQAIIDRTSQTYRRQVVDLAAQINRVARHVPARRARKLHIGLFGYARGLEGVSLPRAISFTCALYSLGLPPELIAFDALTDSDLAFVYGNYPSFQAKIADALRFTDPDGPLMTDPLRQALLRAGFDYAPHTEHVEIVHRIRSALDNNETAQLSDLVLRAALLRRFLG